MIYFFLNIVMYLIILMILIRFFYSKLTIISFIIILFNMNCYFFFIYKNLNFLYGLLLLIMSITIDYLVNIYDKNNKEVVLIKNGNINFHEVLNNYSYHKLINYLKRHHIKLNEVNYCLKQGMKITIIKNQNNY